MKEIWHEVEPFIKELFIFAILIIAYAITDYFTKPLLDPELKEKISTLKNFTFISALSLLSFHALTTISIRIIARLKMEMRVKEDNEQIIDKGNNNQNSKTDIKQLTAQQANDALQGIKKPNFEKVRKR